MIQHLSLDEVLAIHERLVEQFGGPTGVRDLGLLESALARPQATLGGRDLYPDLWTKAAALMHSTIQNHPFVDGNERTALAATGVYLGLNGYMLSASNDETLHFVRRVVSGAIDLKEIAHWLRAHSFPK